jgi:hypothetical protein
MAESECASVRERASVPICLLICVPWMCQTISVILSTVTGLLSPFELNSHLRAQLYYLRGVWSCPALPTRGEAVRPAGENTLASRLG